MKQYVPLCRGNNNKKVMDIQKTLALAEGKKSFTKRGRSPSSFRFDRKKWGYN
jgi:hypothetical protein